YPLYVKDKKVYFDGDEHKKLNAAKAVRNYYGTVVDPSLAQTSDSILASLDQSIAKAAETGPSREF
ncbi:MAG: hypothetical protein AABW49_01845, partial [Nanoarchaeota archaeon]